MNKFVLDKSHLRMRYDVWFSTFSGSLHSARSFRQSRSNPLSIVRQSSQLPNPHSSHSWFHSRLQLLAAMSGHSTMLHHLDTTRPFHRFPLHNQVHSCFFFFPKPLPFASLLFLFVFPFPLITPFPSPLPFPLLSGQ